MTLVSMEELLEQEAPAYGYDALLAYGYREDNINGRKHYVGRDAKMRAVVGPVRHRKFTVTPPPESDETIDFSKLETYAPAHHPQDQPRGLRRVGAWMAKRWYDEEWHKGARNTAGTVLMWSFTGLSLLTFAKGALWVLSM